MSLGDLLHTVLALPMHSVASVALSSLKQVLAKVKRGYPSWFLFLHPHSLLDTKGVLAELGAREVTKFPDTDFLHCD